MTVVCRGLSATTPPLLLPTVLSAYANISPSTHELPLVTTAAEETATATPAVTTLALRLLLLPDSRSSRREGNSETVMYGCSPKKKVNRSEEHTSELQSRGHLVCRLLLEKNN